MNKAFFYWILSSIMFTYEFEIIIKES